MYSIAQNESGYWTAFIRFPYAQAMSSTVTAVVGEHLGIAQEQGGC
jgi:hypothetical protein